MPSGVLASAGLDTVATAELAIALVVVIGAATVVAVAAGAEVSGIATGGVVELLGAAEAGWDV